LPKSLMAQHDYVIANGTGAAVRSDLNNALAAIVSNNSGATEPTTTYAYMPWADTATGLYKIRNGANSAWITLYQLDGEWTNIALEDGTNSAPSLYFKGSGTDTGLYSPGADQVAITTGGTARLTASTTAVTSSLPVASPLGSVGSPSLTFTGDLDTGVYSPGANQIAVATNGVQRVNFNAATEVVFNEDGADVDFRIEGDTKANLLKVDAGTDAVSIDGAFSVTGDATVGSLNGGPLSGMRNKIINGNFDVWQRGTSFTLSTSFQYTADRWRAKVGTGGAGSITRNISSADGNPYLTFAITTAGTGSHELSQPIEFVRSVSGTNGASTSVAVSMRVARTSGTGTLDVSLLQYFGSGGSPSASVSLSLGTITPTSTSTLYSFTGTLASINGKTLGSNNDDQLVLVITPSNAVATYDFAAIQVEPGSVATPFERRSYGQELALCQRYYYFIGKDGTNAAFGAGFTTGTTGFIYGALPVEMRTAPTISHTGTLSDISFTHTGVTAPASSLNNIGSGTKSYSISIGSATGTTNLAGIYARVGSANTALTFSAEL
jgi:hypothetical protein